GDVIVSDRRVERLEIGRDRQPEHVIRPPGTQPRRAAPGDRRQGEGQDGEDQNGGVEERTSGRPALDLPLLRPSTPPLVRRLPLHGCLRWNGSSTSCSPWPRRLKPTTARMTAIPGGRTIQGAAIR